MNKPSSADIQDIKDIQGTLDILDAWRKQGADRLDPVRFHLIQAMAERASNLADNKAKHLVHARLATLIEQYGARIDGAPEAATPSGPDPAVATPAAVSCAPTGALAPAIETATPAASPSAAIGSATAPATDPDNALGSLLAHFSTLAPVDRPHAFATSVSNLRERYPELPVLDEFRAIWSRVSANRQVRQSEQQVHENAGPLNSGHLVHRTLTYMRDVSPGYLHQFLSYLDALGWVEQLQLSHEPPAKETKRAAKKSASGKTRKKPPAAKA